MRSRGFTLIEVLIAMVLVGLAIASLMAANTALTQANGAASEMSTAELLLEQIRELTATKDYTTLQPTFDEVTYDPPHGADGSALSGFDNYSQYISVENVADTDLETVVADGSSDFQRITVDVLLNDKKIASASWVRSAR
jgi:prepilin-type N-terminal cleavage/methylation domain-containing protein